MATIPTDDPWVPVRILGLGLDAEQRVEADVFLLTDDEPELLAGGPGPDGRSAASRPRSSLLADLRSDVGMEWVPSDMWLSYLQLDAAAADLDYDLAVSADPRRRAVDHRRRRRTGRRRAGPPTCDRRRRGGRSPPGVAAGLAVLVASSSSARRRAGTRLAP